MEAVMTRKILLTLMLANAISPHAWSAPVSAATVSEFVADCEREPVDTRLDACKSYLQGAVDQIMLSAPSEQCAVALEKRQPLIEVWLRLSDQAKTAAGREPLWRAVRTAVFLSAPACKPGAR